MTNDRDRLAKSFAGLRNDEEDPTSEEAPSREDARQEAPPETEERAQQGPEDDDGQASLFINPDRPSGRTTDPGPASKTEPLSDAPGPMASEKASRDSAPQVRADGEDPWTAAGLALRNAAPDGQGASQEIMTQIRRDIAYKQGKKVQDAEDETAPVPADAGPKEEVRAKRSKSGSTLLPSLNLSLPTLGRRSVSIAQTLLAMAAVIFALAFGVSQVGLGGGKHYIHFTVDAPSAREVAVVGDFNDWRDGADPLSRAPGSTVWEAWVGVEPGRYRYAFVVDGRIHMVDRARQASFDDELNRGVSILVVPSGGGVPDMIGDAEAAAETTLGPERR